jgi:hypothetical protein
MHEFFIISSRAADGKLLVTHHLVTADHALGRDDHEQLVSPREPVLVELLAQTPFTVLDCGDVCGSTAA